MGSHNPIFPEIAHLIQLDGEGKVIDEYRENSTNRPDITEEAKKILRAHPHFSREIEFYEFAKQRFYRQVEDVLKK